MGLVSRNVYLGLPIVIIANILVIIGFLYLVYLQYMTTSKYIIPINFRNVFHKNDGCPNEYKTIKSVCNISLGELFFGPLYQETHHILRRSRLYNIYLELDMLEIDNPHPLSISRSSSSQHVLYDKILNIELSLQDIDGTENYIYYATAILYRENNRKLFVNWKKLFLSLFYNYDADVYKSFAEIKSDHYEKTVYKISRYGVLSLYQLCHYYPPQVSKTKLVIEENVNGIIYYIRKHPYLTIWLFSLLYTIILGLTIMFSFFMWFKSTSSKPMNISESLKATDEPMNMISPQSADDFYILQDSNDYTNFSSEN